MQIDYIALRSLKSGHVLNDPYTFDLKVSREDISRATVGVQMVALSGATVTTIHRRDFIYGITTIIINDNVLPDNDDLTEFLDSVMSGEVFVTFVSGSEENYVLDSISSPYTKKRIGTNESDFRYSFTIRKV